jgi:hypothetical protein
MTDPTVKHYHISANPELFNKHKRMQTFIAALGMIYPGKLDGAPEKLMLAAGVVQNDQDIYLGEINNYSHIIDEVLIVVHELAPTSDLADSLESLRKETIEYIMGEAHDPQDDYPSEDALEFVTECLEPLMRSPYLRKDSKGVEMITLESLRVRIARLMVKIPKEHWPKD